MEINKFYILTLALSFLFITSCSHNTAVITFRSKPSGANVYDSNNNLLGKTPFTISYNIPTEIYNKGFKAWDLGVVTAYLEGYEPQTKSIAIDISGQRIPGSVMYNEAEKFYDYDFMIEFKSKKSQQNEYEYENADEFYISSFQDTKAGEHPRKRDSFNKSEIPEIIIIGYKGKVVNIKVYSISEGKIYFDKSIYVPNDNRNTYFRNAIGKLSPDSYKVDCSVEGIIVKTLFFSIYN